MASTFLIVVGFAGALASALSPASVMHQTAASSGELWRAADGLFYVDALVNGAPVRFLVDTGASTIVLTRADARRAGVISPTIVFGDVADTAAGRTPIARVRLARMTVGPSVGHDVPAAVAGEGLGVSLLGQSWLTRLDSVTIEGDRMILR